MQHNAHCADGTACNIIRHKLRGYGGIRFTSDGFDCALPVSIDSHSACSFGCLYCFSDNLISHRDNRQKPIGQTSLASIEALFKANSNPSMKPYQMALKLGEKKNGYPCPVQLGAICDPFDNIERNQGWFLEFAKLAIKYNQPVRISTKGNLFLEQEYLDALKPAPHLFRVHYSIISPDDKVLALVDYRAPPASERIQCMANLEKIGVETCLRFRPVLPGISDSTKDYPEAYKTLIQMAAKAGTRNISVEVGFIPGRMTKDLRERWEKIEKICGRPLIQIYSSFGKNQACLRAHHSWTEQIMFAIHKEAKKHNMNFGVSDPLWKELNDFGCCCAISKDHPVFGNWQQEQATEALLKAKCTGCEVGLKDVIPEWSKHALSQNICNPGVGPLNVYKRKHEVWAKKLEESWTDLTKERNTLHYFQGALIPTRKEGNDLFYKFKGLKKRNPKNTPYWVIK